jgi:hypothetical protein
MKNRIYSLFLALSLVIGMMIPVTVSAIEEQSVAALSAKSVTYGSNSYVSSLITSSGGWWYEGYSTSSHPKLDFEFAPDTNFSNNANNPVIAGDNLYATSPVKVGSTWYNFVGGWQNAGETNDSVYLTTTTNDSLLTGWTSLVKVVDHGNYIHANDPSVVIKNGTWYMALTTARFDGIDTISLITSADGATWPSFANSETYQNNEISVSGATVSTMARPSLLWNAASNRWELYFDGKVNGSTVFEQHLAYSSDAIPKNFTYQCKIGDMVDADIKFVNGQYIAAYRSYYETWPTSIRKAVSADGRAFNPLGIVVSPDPLLDYDDIGVSNGGWAIDGNTIKGIFFGGTNVETFNNNKVGFAAAPIIDEAQLREFTSIQFNPRGDLLGMAQSFKVFSRTDFTDWTEVQSFTNIPASLSGTKITFTTPIKTKYLRVEFYDSYNNGDTIQLTKVEFFASPLLLYSRTPVMRKLTVEDLEISASSDYWGTASTMINDNVWFASVGGTPSLSVDITIQVKTNVAISKIVFTANKDGNSNVITYPNKIVFGGGNTATEAKSNPLLKGPNNGSSTVTDAYTNGYSTPGGTYTYSFDYPINNTFVNLNMEGANYQGYAKFQVNGAAIYGYDLDEKGDLQLSVASAKSVTYGSNSFVSSLISSSGGWWYEGYSSESHPKLDFEFASERSISSIDLIPRADYVGMPTAYKIFASNDGVNFGAAGVTVLENYLPIQPSSKGTTLGFDKPIVAKYIRLEFYNPKSGGTIELAGVKFYGTPKGILTERRLTQADLQITASSDLWGTASTMINDDVWFASVGGTPSLSVDITMQVKTNVAISKIVFTANKDENSNVKTYPNKIVFGGGNTATEAKSNPLLKGPNNGSSTVTDAYTNGYSTSGGTYTYSFDYPINNTFVNLNMEGANNEGYPIFQINGAVIYGYDLGELFVNYSISANNILTKVQPGDTLAQFAGRLSTNALALNMTDINNNAITSSSAKVGTGAKLSLSFGATSNIYTVVIYGDVDGDGDIKVADLAAVKQHLLKTQTLTDAILMAGDISKEGKVTISDLLAIKKHILNISTISQG